MPNRPLAADEIAALETLGCRAEDWTRVRVAAAFAADGSVRDAAFSGDVELGAFRGGVSDPDGFVRPAGIRRALLRDASVGDDCLLEDVRVSGADIAAGAILDRVDLLSGIGETAFANGLPVNVLAEDGARAVPLSRFLSAQLAHLLCHMKNHPAGIALESLIAADAQRLRRNRSYVGAGAVIRRSGVLRNVLAGDGARIEGVASLEECHIEGGPMAAHVGEGTAATECVFQRASKVEGGVRLRRCLVGEGVRLSDGFTGEHTLFFANSDFALGEAACAMTGPFAVSHHKATLVLTCQCSFNTFGSAANSSNHHFKLGPRHGGILRRGAKCGSNSYVFWPSDIGAFSSVVGRHAGHLDTAEFPFSLLLGGSGKSVLIPGVNLFGAGCFRDALKWPTRDNRAGLEAPLDAVNPAILSPYTLQAMDAAVEVLMRSVGMEGDFRRGGAVIPASRFDPAVKLYQAAAVFHTGERLFARLAAAGHNAPTARDVVKALGEKPRGPRDPSGGRWRDWGGLLLSGHEADRFLAEVTDGRLADLDAVRERLLAIHAQYDEHEWLWLARRWRERHGEPDREKAIRFLEEWRKAILFRHDCFAKDAGKEYNPEARLGYGVESGASTCFRLVRGEMTDDPVVKLAERERDRLLALADAVGGE